MKVTFESIHHRLAKVEDVLDAGVACATDDGRLAAAKAVAPMLVEIRKDLERLPLTRLDQRQLQRLLGRSNRIAKRLEAFITAGSADA